MKAINQEVQSGAKQFAPKLLANGLKELAEPCEPEDWGFSAGQPMTDFATVAPLLLCGPCGSSLDVAWELLRRDELPVFASVLALSQNSGRGQLRRHWVSGPGNIYAAWRLPLEGIFQTPGASVLLGYLFCQAFAALGLPLTLKWPNDLLLEGRKLGGILLEERGGNLLAGIGLNINSAPPDEFLRAEHSVSAICLRESNAGKNHACNLEQFYYAQLGALRLWSALVQEALMAYKNKVHGVPPRAIFTEAESFLAFRGQKVCITEPDGRKDPLLTGRIVGLDEQGALRLATLELGIYGKEISVVSGSPVLL